MYGTNARLADVGFKIKNTDKNQWVKRQGSTISYVAEAQAETIKTNNNGEILIDGLAPGNYQIYEVLNPNDGYLVQLASPNPASVKLSGGQKTQKTIDNEYQKGDFELEKVNADNEDIKLKGVEFTLKCTEGYYNNKYVGLNDSGSVYYSDTEVRLITGEDGKISINGIWVGTYELQEVNNPNYGYVVESINPTVIIKSRQKTYQKVTNKRKYIKLSGYVWLDEPYKQGKESVRNDLYKDDVIDENDTLMDGIKVELKEISSGKVVATAETVDGKYLFEKVEVANLPNYMVEFTYDGLIYQNVAVHNDKPNGSKAMEPERQEFNDNFATVEAGETENQAAIKDKNSTTKATVEYTFNQMKNGREASINKVNDCQIIANTASAGYQFSYDPEIDLEEIENINLGFYRRNQADLALKNELEQAKVEIAGYGHIYNYGPSYNASDATEEENSWNLGIRFENPYKNIYKRPVYKADAKYEAEPSEMLKMALTYKITISNQAQLTTKVNKIVDYFDSRYELIGIGKGIDNNGNLIGIFGQERYRNQECNVEGYTKIEIDIEELIQSEVENTSGDKNTQSSIYLQFSLPREIILEMLNNNNKELYEDDPQLEDKIKELDDQGKTLRNTAEISSFTTYSDTEGKILYAAVDSDSIPGNATVGDYQTYEDDTDKASSLAIILANARSVSGIVFEDLENEQLSNQKNISEGDAIYNEETESKIGGVKVELVEVDNAGNIKKEIGADGNEKDKVAKIFDEQVVNPDGSLGKWTDSEVNAVSGSDGSYTISGFIPGKYAIKFTWGDGTYKIIEGKQTPDAEDYYESMPENYKSTVIHYDRYQKEFVNSNNKFYREASSSSIHSSHAIDNIDTRKVIDEEFKNYNYESTTNIRQMTSTTPTLEINVEYNDDDITSISYERVENRIAFKINNIDFGIIRRPIQKLNFVKTLTDIKFTLPNGQVLIDAHIDENNNLTGQVPYLTYIAPTKNEKGITVENGLLKIEVDFDLIQGATVDMKYKLGTENISQADYVDDTYGYYQYGESYYQKVALTGENQKDDDVVTLAPTKIVDYLDEKSIYQADDLTNQKYRWRQLSLNELKTERLVAGNVTEALEKGKYEVINEAGEVEIIEDQELNESQIFTTDYLKDSALKPVFTIGDTLYQAQGGEVYMVVSKVLNSSDDAKFQNQAEVVQTNKTGGGKPEWTPGNYIPNYENQEIDDSASQQTTVVPSTGENRAYILPLTVLIVSFVLLGVGIYLIIVKVMKKDLK